MAVLSLMALGVAMVASASPSVADRIGVGDYYFIKKHIIFLLPSLIALISLSMFSSRAIWRVASLILIGAAVMTVMVLIFGDEVKGAKRWIEVFGFTLQPSEFIKPSFAVVAAWLIASHKGAIHRNENTKSPLDFKSKLKPVFYGYHVTVALYGLLIMLLLMQPDLGMTVVITCVFAVQIFLAGLRFRYLAFLLGLGAGGLGMAYLSFHHVRSRIDRFLYPETGDSYQVEHSLDAIRQGGLIGAGPGQGVAKASIPDAHADFIFSVLVEEMGVIFALIMIGLFLFIVLRGFKRLKENQDVFCVLAAGGLLAMFGTQSLIHIGSSVNLLPPKGMTLPFISYGGSSMLSMSIAMGMVLALTRQRRRGSIARSSLSMRRVNPSQGQGGN